MSSRKRLLAWLIAIGGIVAAATAAWSLLPGLLESRAERALEALGLRPVAVVISRIGFERAELSSLTIGDGLGLRLEGIELVYSPRALLGGRIDQIRVRHLVAGATLVDGRLSLGALDVLLAPSPEAESEVGPPLLLPSHVRIDRVTLQLHDGAATWQAEGAAEATLDSGGVTSLIASARARGPGGIHANVAARSRPAGSLELEFDSLVPASTWLAGAPRISIESHTTAKAPWLRFWEKRNAGSPIRELEGSSVAQIALGGISWQERTITSQLDLVVRFVDGRFRATARRILVTGLDRPVEASAAFDGQLEPARIESAQLAISPFVWQGAELPALAASFRGALTAEAGRGHLTLATGPGSAALPVAALRGASLRLPLEVEVSRERFVARLPDCGSLRVSAGAIMDGLRFRKGVDWCVRDEDEPLLALEFGDGPVRGALRALFEPARIDVELSDSLLVDGTLPALTVATALGSDDVRIHARGGRLRTSAVAFELSDIDANLALRLGASPDWAVQLSRLALHPLAEAPLETPLALAGTLSGDLLFARFELAAHEPQGRFRVAASGVHDITTGFGTARLTIPRVEFSETGLQPADLLRDTQDLPTLDGAVMADGAIAWNPERALPHMDIRIDGLSAHAESLTVERASGVVELIGLDPITTAPSQRLKAARVDVGVPLMKPALEFQLVNGVRLEIARFEAEVAGGRVNLAGAVAEGDADQALAIGIEEVDVAEILRLAEIDDLIAHGRLSGHIPVLIQHGRISIPGGQLNSLEGGLIQLPPESNEVPLEAIGAEGAFVREVLSDLHFSDLGLRINGDLSNRLKLTFEVRGSNPRVQGGRPIHLTLTLNESFSGAARVADLAQAWLRRLGRGERTDP